MTGTRKAKKMKVAAKAKGKKGTAKEKAAQQEPTLDPEVEEEEDDDFVSETKVRKLPKSQPELKKSAAPASAAPR